jgi:uracil-DNA glycosylase family 4
VPSNFVYEPTGEVLTFLPGHTVLGRYGPSKSKVMVIGKWPMPEDMSAMRYAAGRIGDEWKDILTSKRINFDSWYVTSAYKFLPKGVARPDVKMGSECIPLLFYELYHVQPEYIICMGADAVKALFGSKATLAQFRNQVTDFEWPDRFKSKVICTCTPAEVLMAPETRPVMEQDLDLLVGLLQDRPVVEKIPTNYRYIDTFKKLDSWIDEMLENDCKVFSVDCEWAGDNPRCDPNTNYLRSIQFCWGVGLACYLDLTDETGSKKLLSKGKYYLAEKLKRLLFGREGVSLIGHNLRADLPWLIDLGLEGKEFEDIILDSFDTMLANHCLDETSGHGLDDLTLKYTDMGKYDSTLQAWIKEQKISADQLDLEGYARIPTEILFLYGCADVDATFRVAIIFMEMLAKIHKEDLKFGEFYEDGTPITLATLFYNIENRATLPILEMEMTGIPVDTERLQKLIGIYHEARDKLDIRLKEQLNWPEFNFRSVDQVRMLLYAGQDFKGKKPHIVPSGAKTFNFTPMKASDKKAPSWDRIIKEGTQKLYGPSTDSDVLGDLLIHYKDHPDLKLLRDLRFVDQACKNFLRDKDEETGEYDRGLHGAVQNGRIHTHISQLAETGRYKSYSPNLQNLPSGQEEVLHKILEYCDYKDVPKIRSCFVAPSGWVLVSADFTQAELFVMAWLSQDENMMSILSNPERNLHLEAANKIFNLGYDLTSITAEEAKEIKSKHKNEYTRAKAVNFGIPYGSGGSGLSQRLRGEGVNVSAAEGNEYVKSHAELFPKLHEFLQSVSDAVSDPGYYRTVYGRYRRFASTKDDAVRAAQEREAKNFPIQGAVADNLTRALIKFWEYKRKYGINSYKIILPVHDQIIFAVQPNYVKEFIKTVIPLCMVFPIPKLGISLASDVDIYLRWSETPKFQELVNLGVDETIAKEFGKA